MPQARRSTRGGGAFLSYDGVMSSRTLPVSELNAGLEEASRILVEDPLSLGFEKVAGHYGT